MSLLDTAHEIWATAQLLPGEGIVDGVGRVESLLSQCRKEARKEVLDNYLESMRTIFESSETMTWADFEKLTEELRRMAESSMEGEK